MQGAILLAKENKELRAANEKQKQKRTSSRKQIPAKEGLSVQEASALITEPVEAVEPPPPHPPSAKKAFLRHLYSRELGLYQPAGSVKIRAIGEMHVQIDDYFSLFNLMAFSLSLN